MASKSKRQDRFLQKSRHIHRQFEIAKNIGFEESPHYFHKKTALTCGNSKCVMCGNPRKFFGAVTMQEERFNMFCEVVD